MSIPGFGKAAKDQNLYSFQALLHTSSSLFKMAIRIVQKRIDLNLLEKKGIISKAGLFNWA
jgi:hypothetical protein